MHWKFYLATGALLQGATLIGEGAAALAPGLYPLGNVTDFAAGIPILNGGPGARITADPEAVNAIIVPADVVARVIASKAAHIEVVAAAPEDGTADLDVASAREE